MVIKRIGLSWVSISDFKASKKFFTETLGLKVVQEQPDFGWLELQGVNKGQVLGVGLANSEAGMKAGVNAVVTFVVDNYDDAKKELLSKGIILFDEIAGIPEVPRMVCFKDLDGNTFQIVEETAGHTDK